MATQAVALQNANSELAPGVADLPVRHADISPQSRANCPGDRWVRSGRFQPLADAVGLRTVSP